MGFAQPGAPYNESLIITDDFSTKKSVHCNQIIVPTELVTSGTECKLLCNSVDNYHFKE